MMQTITTIVRLCPYCQRYNKQTQKYGHVPSEDVQHLQPWDEVCVDMIGPWKITVCGTEYKFRALACIDSVICLPEIVPVHNATSKTVAEAFEIIIGEVGTPYLVDDYMIMAMSFWVLHFLPYVTEK